VHTRLDYGFRLISRGTSSLFLTPRLVWFIDCVVTTTSRTPLQPCIGSVCQNGSISRWQSRLFACCTVCSTNLLESADPRRRSARSSPTSFIVVTTAASSTIPSVYCGTSFISCSSIRSLEFLATGHSVVPSLSVFRQRLKTFLFRKSFTDILLRHSCSHRTRFRGLRNSFTIWTTLKIAIGVDIDISARRRTLPRGASALSCVACVAVPRIRCECCFSALFVPT